MKTTHSVSSAIVEAFNRSTQRGAGKSSAIKPGDAFLLLL